MKYLIIILSLLTTTAHARGYNSFIGTSLTYTKLSDPNYQYIDEHEQFQNPRFNSINFGNNIEFDNNVNVGFRIQLYNKPSKRTVRHVKSNTVMISEADIRTDSAYIGKRFNKFIPMISITNAKVDKKLYKGNDLAGRQINHGLLYSFGATYILSENVSSYLFCILPNKDLNHGLTLGVNYLI